MNQFFERNGHAIPTPAPASGCNLAADLHQLRLEVERLAAQVAAYQERHIALAPGGVETDSLVTLDQAAALVHRSKRTLERYKKRMPPPAIPGLGGQASLWGWSTIRPWLEATFRIPLHPDMPARRRV